MFRNFFNYIKKFVHFINNTGYFIKNLFRVLGFILFVILIVFIVKGGGNYVNRCFSIIG